MLESIARFFEVLAFNMRAADILDVLLTTVFLYAIFVWIRDRISRVVGFGIALIGVIYGLAHYLGLYLMLMVFRVGAVVIALAVVVVFQDDIRRLFEKIRVMNPWKASDPKFDQHQLEVLVEAVERMARGRVGALIVLPGREALGVHLHGGIEARATLSVPLLESIFHPKTPGHDGAVIIEDGRIDRIAVHLPLSTRHAKLNQGGTRHAAGLGLAERSDALVIVVSEERGTVSVAQEHELVVLDSAADLGPRIEAFHASSREHPEEVRWLPHWLTRNFRLKILALLVASTLWLFFAHRVENVRRTYEVPIEYRGLAEQWYVEEPKPINARVEFTGSERAFDNVDPARLKLSVDLSALSKGSQRIALEDAQLDAPAGISVAEINPPVLNLTASEMVKTKVAVRAQINGKPLPGYEVKKVVTEPGRVQVRVPKAMASTIRELQTEPISLEGLDTSKSLKVQLLPGKDIRFPGDAPPVVSVRLEIEKAAEH
ncbi:diadenylate cyclase [Bradymonas sediminis]|uniref:Uncharacterized protein n=1 Tax=Bradymonas sediminis TaxID=1548548 RepID=A0A2Z4FJR8_9DELT|nr:diadenylate cyclase [Bradymonas sediminis]AWV89120.1 hypothetical protein DN745_07135 [Bradymonas sediminis]TDP64414.1 uncharacterized protein (TIGR00159 family) [Bradymonas sediminis]